MSFLSENTFFCTINFRMTMLRAGQMIDTQPQGICKTISHKAYAKQSATRHMQNNQPQGICKTISHKAYAKQSATRHMQNNQPQGRCKTISHSSNRKKATK